MRKLAARFALAATTIATACSPPPAPASPPAPRPATATNEPVVLSIVATSDLHGYIHRVSAFGGYVDNLRRARKDDGGVVLVDAGDMFQGTIAANTTEGAAVIRAYNALGYHAAVIGNHEFDYGPVGPPVIPAAPSDDPRGALLAAAKLAKFPLLAANIVEEGSGRPVQWPGVCPSSIVRVAGVPVGIIGVSSETTLEATIAGNVDDLRMAPLADAIAREARLLRERGAKVVVAAAHAGGACESFDRPNDLSSCKPGEVFEIARKLDPDLVDVIIGAHTHQAVAHRVHGIPVIQSYAYGTAFGRVDLAFDRDTGDASVLRIHPPHRICQEKDKHASTCTTGPYEGAEVSPSSTVAAAVAPDLKRAKAKRNELVGVTLPEGLSKDGEPSSPLGDRVAAWMLAVRPEADVAIMNAGGLRASLPPGPLAYGTFYEMFPFDNRFASASVGVSALRALLAHYLEHGTGFSLAGVDLQARCKDGSLDVILQRDGRKLRDDEEVVVLMSDYLAMTSTVSDAGMPLDSFEIEAEPAIREALVEHLRREGGSIRALNASPITVVGGWPIRCST